MDISVLDPKPKNGLFRRKEATENAEKMQKKTLSKKKKKKRKLRLPVTLPQITFGWAMEKENVCH